MSYTPTTWATGDVITAEKLNNMEQGIVNGSALIVHFYKDGTIYKCDKTIQEINDHLENYGPYNIIGIYASIDNPWEAGTVFPLVGYINIPNAVNNYKFSICEMLQEAGSTLKIKEKMFTISETGQVGYSENVLPN